MKQCPGPSHLTPVMLPVTVEHWNFHRTGYLAGKPISRCKQCMHWYYAENRARKRGNECGYVDRVPVAAFLCELIARCGSQEKVERTYGIWRSVQAKVLRTNLFYVQRRTAARILIALDMQRRHDRKHGMRPAFHEELRERGRRLMVMDAKLEKTKWQIP